MSWIKPAMSKTPDVVKAGPLSEQTVIADFFEPLTEGDKSALGLLDDAALIDIPDNHELVVTKDILVAGTHFFADDPPADIGHKALAVNLSDLAAKGAAPRSYLLALALDKTCGEAWLRAFASGLGALQRVHGCRLIGGDTVVTGGPLAISITAFGLVPRGTMVKRGGAQPGDPLYVTGTVGDAALGLKIRSQIPDYLKWELEDSAVQYLVSRYLRPQPRLALAPFLRQYATASIDISDGLLGDFQKLCSVSGVGGTIEESRIPFSEPARKCLDRDPGLFDTLVSGGDDYEILFTVNADARDAFEKDVAGLDFPVAFVGLIAKEGEDCGIAGADGHIRAFDHVSYDHFG